MVVLPQSVDVLLQSVDMLPQPVDVLPQSMDVLPQPLDVLPQYMDVLPQSMDVLPQSVDVLPQSMNVLKYLLPQSMGVLPQSRSYKSVNTIFKCCCAARSNHAHLSHWLTWFRCEAWKTPARSRSCRRRYKSSSRWSSTSRAWRKPCSSSRLVPAQWWRAGYQLHTWSDLLQELLLFCHCIMLFFYFFADTFGHFSHNSYETCRNSIHWFVFSEVMTALTYFFWSLKKLGLWPIKT